MSATWKRMGSVIARKPRAAGPPSRLADLLELEVGQHRRGEGQLERGLRRWLEQVVLGSDGRLGGHDDLFPDRVHWRVRDLREELLEVVVEQLGAFREDGQGGVVAHRPDRVGARRGHRVDDHPDVLGGVAEDLLAAQDRLVVRLDDARRVRQVVELGQPGARPLPVGLRIGHPVLELVVGDDPALGRVDEEHAPGLEAALGDDLVGRDVEDAGFRGHDRPAVPGHVVAGRPEAVPVERGPDADAIGERDRRRPVPGLHQAGVVLVERPPGWGHGFVAVPGLRDHHHHAVGERPPGKVEQLQHVVEDRRVGSVRVDRREHLRGGPRRTPTSGTSTGGRAASSRCRAAC